MNATQAQNEIQRLTNKLRDTEKALAKEAAKVAELRAELDKVRGMLKKHEWAGQDEWDSFCPECRVYEGADPQKPQCHAPHCALAELLK